MVNKAELEMYIVPQTNYTYQTPGELTFTPVDTSGKVITSFARNAQRNTSDTTWLNIAPIPVTNSRYTLLLTEYLQQKLIEPQITNAADRFFINRQVLRADRVLIAGPNYPNPAYRMKLNLIYTPVK